MSHLHAQRVIESGHAVVLDACPRCLSQVAVIAKMAVLDVLKELIDDASRNVGNTIDVGDLTRVARLVEADIERTVRGK